VRIKALIFIVISTGAWTLTINVPKGAEEQSPPDEITLEDEGYKSNRRGPVYFSHLNHAEDYGVLCEDCHHHYQDGENVWEEGDPVKRCAECHDPRETKGKIKNLKLAFHKNCKNCHRELAKEGITKDAPYRKCSDCHGYR
jgi:hypothetical protein